MTAFSTVRLPATVRLSAIALARFGKRNGLRLRLTRVQTPCSMKASERKPSNLISKMKSSESNGRGRRESRVGRRFRGSDGSDKPKVIDRNYSNSRNDDRAKPTS